MIKALRYYLAAALLVVAGVLVAINTKSSPKPAARTYTGAQSCLTSNCHAGQYGDGESYKGAAAFRETMHTKIHLRPNPETVIIDRWFREKRVLKIQDKQIPTPGQDTLLIELSKGDREDEYYIQLRFSGGGDSLPKMKVAYTYGGEGWLQRFLVEINGSYYVPPFQYVLPEYRNQSDTGYWVGLDMQKWYVSSDPSTGKARFLRWEKNEFLKLSWDHECAACHVNGFGLTVDAKPGTTDTANYASWVGIAEGDSALIDQNVVVGCESCHGPGSEHVASPSKNNIFTFSVLPKTKEGTDRKLDLCNYCHTRGPSKPGRVHRYPFDEANNEPFVPGGDRPLSDFLFPRPTVWDDGKTSYAHHQHGDDYSHSKQYASHLFVDGCSDCHLSHYNKPGLPFQLKEDYYSLEDGVGCMKCHGIPKAQGGKSEFPADNLGRDTVLEGKTVNAHTFHSQGVSQCVNCHFTATATISFDGKYNFTDHSFRVLSPEQTIWYYRRGATIGQINSCAASCHRNGRGERNRKPGDPLAPDFGIVDLNPVFYKEKSDSLLADTLFKRWKQWGWSVQHPGSGVEGTNIAVTGVSPNPMASGSTLSIQYNVQSRSSVRVQILDMLGRNIRYVSNGMAEPGNYTAVWDANDNYGKRVSSGAYMVRITTPAGTISEKVIVLP
ncbi:MAG: T9SS type A sorting domain-containing protein [Chlorobi bacterium]|nr:MAG: arabinogalactan endo-1,4-beta-galactosidase [Chlorobi bacterium OLB7]MBK8912429.1 T9SS type A sorting domain-containing protein [Chlorobiota bacterium]MBX7218096.1 T9SS type A sorting domain-containing protein [Candidatus Kapabacteria bacterium]